MTTFDTDGLIATGFARRLAAISPFTRDGVLKTRFLSRLEQASKVDRSSGLPTGDRP